MLQCIRLANPTGCMQFPCVACHHLAVCGTHGHHLTLQCKRNCRLHLSRYVDRWPGIGKHVHQEVLPIERLGSADNRNLIAIPSFISDHAHIAPICCVQIVASKLLQRPYHQSSGVMLRVVQLVACAEPHVRPPSCSGTRACPSSLLFAHLSIQLNSYIQYKVDTALVRTVLAPADCVRQVVTALFCRWRQSQRPGVSFYTTTPPSPRNCCCTDSHGSIVYSCIDKYIIASDVCLSGESCFST